MRKTIERLRKVLEELERLSPEAGAPRSSRRPESARTSSSDSSDGGNPGAPGVALREPRPAENDDRAGLRCLFLGILSRDGEVELDPRDEDDCRTVLEGFPPASRAFWERKMGLQDKGEDEGES